mgnify:CR=1 FL=1
MEAEPTKKLFKVADNMMYQSKKAKNQVTISFLDEMVGSADSNLKRRNRDYESKRLLYKIWRRF